MDDPKQWSQNFEFYAESAIFNEPPKCGNFADLSDIQPHLFSEHKESGEIPLKF